MQYLEFKKRIQNKAVFNSRDLELLGEDRQTSRNQIRRWQKKGLLLKLKKGLYILNKDERKFTPSRAFIAAQLYTPSYISLEYALNFYGLIPEKVADVTSLSTKKTKYFSNGFGFFVYRHIQPASFTGFLAARDETGLPYFMAAPEKAVVDFFYFNLPFFKGNFLKIFKDNYRLQNVSKLKTGKLLKFAAVFKNKKLLEVCRQFCHFIKEEAE